MQCLRCGSKTNIGMCGVCGYEANRAHVISFFPVNEYEHDLCFLEEDSSEKDSLETAIDDMQIQSKGRQSDVSDYNRASSDITCGLTAEQIEELEIRIGACISGGLPKSVLMHFDMLKNREEMKRWLESNKPDFRRIVEEECERLRWELSLN